MEAQQQSDATNKHGLSYAKCYMLTIQTYWQQFVFVPFLFQRTDALCIKQLHKEMVFPVWCGRTSPDLNTFGMNWNADCEPDQRGVRRSKINGLERYADP